MNIDRLDEWCFLFASPSAVPHRHKLDGSVFRGMSDLAMAQAYAEAVSRFFSLNGLDKPVFVVRGPTSTTREPYEVVDATSGYCVLHRVQVDSEEKGLGPQPGMTLRAVLLQYGLEAVRGLPLDVGLSVPQFISDRCLDGDIATYAALPGEVWRIKRFYGGDAPDSNYVNWIDVNEARVADGAAQVEKLPEAVRACSQRQRA